MTAWMGKADKGYGASQPYRNELRVCVEDAWAGSAGISSCPDDLMELNSRP